MAPFSWIDCGIFRWDMHARVLLVTLLVLALGAGSALGQNNRYTERSFVASPAVRAMGDAGVALLGPERPFLYNPAQVPHVSSHFTVAGVQASASRNLRRQIRLFNDRVQPAIETNFELESGVLEKLYRDVNRLGRHPLRGTGAVLLPSFVYSAGAVGIGGGLFAKTALNYRVSNAGAGVPEVYLLSRTDVMAVASLGVDLGGIGLSGVTVGVTAKRTRRFLAFENKPLDTFTKDEAAILLEGNMFQVDVGALYRPPWWDLPGTLSLGAAAYDVLDHRYEYAFGGAPGLPFLDDIIANSATLDAGVAAQEAERARQRFQLDSSYRIGLAYRAPSVLFLDDVGLTVGYQGYGAGRQHPLARVHAGVRARLTDGLILRGGLSAGYPTGGLGVEFGAFHIDYALHAFEEGRVPGRLETYVHTARITLRIE